jgi:N4-gp56 family major capsid protein
MALGSPHVTNTTAATFIPELWSDEIIAAYKKSLVLANLVSKMPMKGKKGDTIHIPKPTRGDASVKNPETQVSLIAATESEVVVTIDKHYEYSRLIEDITDVQALSSLRRFYTEDAGYALARQVDTDLFAEVDGLATKYEADAGGLVAWTTGAPAAITDVAIRAAIQKLDDNDVPMDNRVLVVPPSAINALRGIDRYMSSDFMNDGRVQNGKVGALYGVDVYVSTNCPTPEAGARLGVMMHKDAFVLAEQLGVRTQTQYKQEWLSDLMTADTIYGVQTLRAENAVALVVPA